MHLFVFFVLSSTLTSDLLLSSRRQRVMGIKDKETARAARNCNYGSRENVGANWMPAGIASAKKAKRNIFWQGSAAVRSCWQSAELEGLWGRFGLRVRSGIHTGDPQRVFPDRSEASVKGERCGVSPPRRKHLSAHPQTWESRGADISCGP